METNVSQELQDDGITSIYPVFSGEEIEIVIWNEKLYTYPEGECMELEIHHTHSYYKHAYERLSGKDYDWELLLQDRKNVHLIKAAKDYGGSIPRKYFSMKIEKIPKEYDDLHLWRVYIENHREKINLNTEALILFQEEKHKRTPNVNWELTDLMSFMIDFYHDTLFKNPTVTATIFKNASRSEIIKTSSNKKRKREDETTSMDDYPRLSGQMISFVYIANLEWIPNHNILEPIAKEYKEITGLKLDYDNLDILDPHLIDIVRKGEPNGNFAKVFTIPKEYYDSGLYQIYNLVRIKLEEKKLINYQLRQEKVNESWIPEDLMMRMIDLYNDNLFKNPELTAKIFSNETHGIIKNNNKN